MDNYDEKDGLGLAIMGAVVVLAWIFAIIFAPKVMAEYLETFPTQPVKEAIVQEVPIDEGITTFEDFGLYKLYKQKLESGELSLYKKEYVGSYNETAEKLRKRTAADDPIFERFEKDKQLLRDKLGEFPALNWERFESTELVLVDESISGEEEGGTVLAHYSTTTNRISALKEAQEADEAKLSSIFVHELAHALTVSRGSVLLYDGLAEVIAYYTTGQAVGTAYILPYCLIAITMRSQGLEKTLLYIKDDFMEPVFDNKMGKGAFADLMSISAKYASGEQYANIELLAAWDLLCHYAVAMGAQDVMKEFTLPKTMTTDCMNYFSKILNKKSIY